MPTSTFFSTSYGTPRISKNSCSRRSSEVASDHNIPKNAKPAPSLYIRSRELHICRVSAEVTKHLMGALDILPNGTSMQFIKVSMDIGEIFPETITPELLPRAATKPELIYPPPGAAILHATNGVAHMRLVYLCYPGRHNFRWIAEKPHNEYPSRELWLHMNRYIHPYEVPPIYALRDLDTLVIEACPDEGVNSKFFSMLAPGGGGVPSPLLSRTPGCV